MSDYKVNRIKEIYEEMLTLNAELDQLLSSSLTHRDYERVKVYGLGYIESGLTRDGAAYPTSYTVQDVIEELDASSFDEDFIEDVGGE